MAEITAKERAIAASFYDSANGFGGIEQTYRAARAADPTITRQDVRAFLAKQELRQRRKPHKVNSFVPLFPRQEFQVDLLDQGANVNPRYGLTAIDIFSKKAACIPINSKIAPVTAQALRRVFDELGYPTSIMCDEGGEFMGQFAHECEEEDVKIIRSRTGGRFVERLIRTLKMRIFERKKALGGSWTQYVQPVLDQYNDNMHSSTHASPNHVVNHEYDIPVLRRAHAWMVRSAKFPVQHEALSVGDFVKIRIKQHSFYKETFNSWSPTVYTITSIDNTTPEGTTYHLQGYRRPLLRFELKKIEDVQRVNHGQLQSALNVVRHQVQPQLLALPPPPAPVHVSAAEAAPAGPAVADAAEAAPAVAVAPPRPPRVRRPNVLPARPNTRAHVREQRAAAANQP